MCAYARTCVCVWTAALYVGSKTMLCFNESFDTKYVIQYLCLNIYANIHVITFFKYVLNNSFDPISTP